MNSTDASQPAADARPVVAMPRSNRGVWLFGVALAIGGVVLFTTLESSRQTLAAPPITAAPDISAGMIMAPSELELPRPAYPAYYLVPSPRPVEAAAFGQRQPSTPPQARAAPKAAASPAPPSIGGYEPARASPYSPPMGGDLGFARSPYQPPAAVEAPEPPAVDGQSSASDGKDRVEAGRFVHPATTVPKGTVIQAVLETAVDSNRAGFARAIVSRDVMGFDGSRVLIPRGSRILGEYKSDVAMGQNRVLIQWQRLTRPDGVVINMDSPSADPLGRAGVKGRVNTHFLQRFAGAILQSALDIGVQLATREVGRDTVYIGLPGVTQGVITPPDKIPPTVTVKQGRSVSVFVARDLDFTKVS